MGSPDTQPEDAGIGDKLAHHVFIPALVPESGVAFATIQTVAEVRLPIIDERRPGKDASEAELLPPDSAQHSSSSQPSSSSSSSLQASPAVSYSSDQPDLADNISLSSTELISEHVNSSSSEEARPKGSALHGNGSRQAKAFPNAQSQGSPRCREREGNRYEGLKLARQRYQQEKAARQQQTQPFKGSRVSSKAEHREDTLPVALTLPQSKPASSIETPPFPIPKPMVRLPGQQSVMAHSKQSSTRGGDARGSSMPFGSGRVNYQRPFSRPFNSRPYPAKSTGRYNAPDWTTWQDLTIKIHDLPATATTRDLYRCFSRQGNIVRIELYENTRGERDGKASVKFNPPPAMAFWEHGMYSIPITVEGTVNARLFLEARKRNIKYPSPANAEKTHEEVMVMKASSLDFGMMLDPSTMAIMCRVLPTDAHDIQFRLSMLHREITVEFLLDIRDQRIGRGNSKPSHYGKDDRQEIMRFRIPLAQLDAIQRVETSEDKIILLISLDTPPKFFKKLDAGQTHDDNAKYWSENDTWYRQTDVVYAHGLLQKTPLTLKKTRPVLDLGRWTTYRLVFKKSDKTTDVYGRIRQALQNYNIGTLPLDHLELPEQLTPPVWEFLDKPFVRQHGFRADMLELNGERESPLSFQVRYQLEVCISNGYLNEYKLSKAFVSHLKNMHAGEAQDLLEYVANQGKRVYDPTSLFNIRIADGAPLRAKVPHYCVYIRSATVTPTTVYFQTPIAETSNRVIRKYSHYADRFLRVRFTEEKTDGGIYATDKETMNEVFTRVKRVLANGIVVGDRTYEFLACGNSQFREHGAYFFAPLPHLSTERIRSWMGMFKEIKTVPLYLARLGQCFSTTRAIHGATTEVKEMEDIARNGYNFSDGVGKISPLLAQVAASELGLLQNSEEPPSVFQIRAGGCKGVLAVWPMPGHREVYIRRSQYKFPAHHDGLEIIRWSQFACANLNQQLILILSALGVPDDVFSQKLRLQLSNLEQAMTNEKMALAILQKDIDHNQMTLVVASMILDGFQKTEEPFLTSLLQLWRAWSIKYLKEKARITISGGGLFFGCVDETAILRGHYNDIPSPPNDAPIEEKAKNVPEVFVQLSKNAEGKPEVILGPMLLARNPSLHPGDVRVVRGVDVAELHHLKDVVVLPQTGDRDIASMCSGGDLDGDDFLVIWDKDLLPHEWNVEPMDYSRPPVMVHGRDIGIDDLTTFFVTYMKNDTLSRIAKAHLANADYMEEGVRDETCLKLANLHSQAVDYVKTGHAAQMPRNLKPPKRPHFMDNTYQRKENTYISRKVLGQLYDQVERIDFVPAFSAPFDDRISQAYEYQVDDELLASAREIKTEYDAHMRRIMAQHEIKTEFELWSTFVLEHSRTTSDFKFHEQIGQISTALKEQFKGICYERAGGKSFQQIGPYAVAMYKVTATEMAQAVQECHQMRVVGGQMKPLRKMISTDMPFMSFPWLFQDVLGRIAKNSEFTAKGLNVEDDADGNAARNALKTTTQARKEAGKACGPVNLGAVSDLETAQRTTHVGDLLELFEDSHV